MTTPAQQAESLIRSITEALVDKPEAIRLEVVSTDSLITINLSVDQTDVGKIIGKQGRTARSVRTLLAGFSMGRKVRCELNIADRKPL